MLWMPYPKQWESPCLMLQYCVSLEGLTGYTTDILSTFVKGIISVMGKISSKSLLACHPMDLSICTGSDRCRADSWAQGCNWTWSLEEGHITGCLKEKGGGGRWLQGGCDCSFTSLPRLKSRRLNPSFISAFAKCLPLSHNGIKRTIPRSKDWKNAEWVCDCELGGHCRQSMAVVRSCIVY